MAAPKPETYSPTGRMIYRKMLERGMDRRDLAGALFGQPGAQKRLTKFLQRDHTARTLLRTAEVLDCPASDLLPPSFFRDDIANLTMEAGNGS